MSLAGNQKQHDLPVLKSEVYRNERSIDTRPLAQLWQQQNSLICEKPRMDDVSLSMSFMSTDPPTLKKLPLCCLLLEICGISH